MSACPNHLRHPVGAGWALVGDAGYHRDPITGHGISDAFRDAELLADRPRPPLAGDTDEVDALANYHAARDRNSREIFDITCELATYPRPTGSSSCRNDSASAIDAQADPRSPTPRYHSPPQWRERMSPTPNPPDTGTPKGTSP